MGFSRRDRADIGVEPGGRRNNVGGRAAVHHAAMQRRVGRLERILRIDPFRGFPPLRPPSQAISRAAFMTALTPWSMRLEWTACPVTCGAKLHGCLVPGHHRMAGRLADDHGGGRRDGLAIARTMDGAPRQASSSSYERAMWTGRLSGARPSRAPARERERRSPSCRSCRVRRGGRPLRQRPGIARPACPPPVRHPCGRTERFRPPLGPIVA